MEGPDDSGFTTNKPGDDIWDGTFTLAFTLGYLVK